MLNIRVFSSVLAEESWTRKKIEDTTRINDTSENTFFMGRSSQGGNLMSHFLCKAAHVSAQNKICQNWQIFFHYRRHLLWIVATWTRRSSIWKTNNHWKVKKSFRRKNEWMNENLGSSKNCRILSYFYTKLSMFFVFPFWFPLDRKFFSSLM